MIEITVGLFVLGFGAILYFLPSAVGSTKKNALAIFMCNLFFGWTVIGWILTLIWACMQECEPIESVESANSPKTYVLKVRRSL
jgi:Superinfection immunity protein